MIDNNKICVLRWKELIDAGIGVERDCFAVSVKVSLSTKTDENNI